MINYRGWMINGMGELKELRIKDLLVRMEIRFDDK
jgi:hypothetical protein